VRIAAKRSVLELELDASDGAGISWLHRHTEVLSKELRDDGRMVMSVRVDPTNVGRVRAKFGPDNATEGRE
jgi:GTP-binding protein HflX